MLPEERRVQLDGIVSQMVQNNEPDDAINFVVNDFKSKYDKPATKPAPQEQGFLSKRISNISNPKPSAIRSFSPTLGALANVAGQTGGLIVDAGMGALKAGYEALPKSVQENVAGIGKLIRTNPIVDAAITAFGALPEGVQNDIENVGNASLLFPAGRAAGALKPAAKEALNIGRDAVSSAMSKTPAMLDADLTNVISKGIDKAIRPTVVGKRTAPQVKAYYGKAKTAVKSIIDNKNNLILTDAEGNATTGLPKTLKQFSEAVDQTKRNVFQQYDDMAKAAGETGVQVDLAPAVKELESISRNKVLNDLSPEITNYAAQRAEALSSRGVYTTTEAQDAIAHLNKSLESFYKNPSYETANRAGVDSLIVNNIRKSLDNAIEGVSGAGYQELKNTYGALKTIEKEVNHRAIVDARKNIKGLLDFTDVMTSGELIGGLMTMNPALIARGAAGKGIKEYFKRLNNPDRIVKSMFADAENILSKSTTQPEMRSGLGKLIQGEQYAGPTINGPYPGGMEVGPVISGVPKGEPYGPQPGRLIHPKQLPAGQGFELVNDPNVIDAAFRSKTRPVKPTLRLPDGRQPNAPLSLPQGQGFVFKDVDYGIPVGEPYGPDIIDVPFRSKSSPVLHLPPGQIPAERPALPPGQGFELRPNTDELGAILADMKREGTKALPPGQGFTLVDKPTLKKPAPKPEIKVDDSIGANLRAVRERQAPPKAGAQNLVTRIQELGGIKAGKDYNAKLLRQNPDAKRVLNNTTGKTPDEMAQILTGEGWQLESSDQMIELLKSGKGRKMYAPEQADTLYNRDIRSAEHEWIEKQLREIEAKDNLNTSATREDLSDIQARAADEIRTQGLIDPAREEAALKEIEDFFASVTNSNKNQKPKSKGKLTANPRQDTPASKGVLTKPKE